MEEPEADDPRRVRTAAALEAAIRRLSATQSIDSISVSLLCREAGISRATFYNHARSPAELLDRLLTAELDVLRARARARIVAERRSTVIDGMADVMGHLAQHRMTYLGPDRTGIRPQLRNLLIDHFRISLLQIFPEGADRAAAADDVPPERAALVADFLANGYVGALDFWLRHPEIGSDDAVRDLLLQVTPPWMLD